MNLKEAKAQLKPLGMTVNKSSAWTASSPEYRVNLIGGEERTAYYTPDLNDAVGTARAIYIASKGASQFLDAHLVLQCPNDWVRRYDLPHQEHPLQNWKWAFMEAKMTLASTIGVYGDTVAALKPDELAEGAVRQWQDFFRRRRRRVVSRRRDSRGEGVA